MDYKQRKIGLKKLKEKDNEITNLEKRLKLLEWERREIINHYDLNKEEKTTNETV